VKKFPVLFIIISILAAQMPEAKAQCDIKSKLYADGTMYYFIEPLPFYKTDEKKLEGGVVTDNENYFITLYPSPVPQKTEGLKLKSDIQLTLVNQQTYKLRYYDSQYDAGDTVLKMVFKIDKKDIDDLGKFDVDKIVMNMGKEGERTYNFRLHKAAIHEQLTCLRNRSH
jgi:hypothetical protein